MSFENIRIVDGVVGVSKFSDLCESYLSPLKTLCGGRTYYLVQQEGSLPVGRPSKPSVRGESQPSSLLSTIIKVLSYFTLILPIIAVLYTLHCRKVNVSKQPENSPVLQRVDKPEVQVIKAQPVTETSAIGRFKGSHGLPREIRILPECFSYPVELEEAKEDQWYAHFLGCLSSFSQEISSEGDRYCVLASETDSSYKMAQMALPQLLERGKLPQFICKRNEFGMTISLAHKKVVLFYDGEEPVEGLVGLLKEIEGRYRTNKFKPHLILVVPRLPDAAKERIEQMDLLSFSKITLITS